MGFRFRRRLRIMPGLSLNISKSGISTSIGGRGATFNISKHGTRTTVGLPGTGLSYRSPTQHWNQPDNASTNDAPSNDTQPPRGTSALAGIILAILAFGALWFIAAVWQ